MREILIVGSGGFIGAALRYLIGGWTHRILDASHFPVGTLIVNIIGCFAIGLLGGLTESRQFFAADTRLFIFVGILGGFTTFSSFGYETLNLLRDGATMLAFANALLQIGLGLGAVWGGMIICRYV